jgi:hypothetical protein
MAFMIAVMMFVEMVLQSTPIEFQHRHSRELQHMILFTMPFPPRM